jgi:hypothetical protein
MNQALDDVRAAESRAQEQRESHRAAEEDFQKLWVYNSPVLETAAIPHCGRALRNGIRLAPRIYEQEHYYKPAASQFV